MLDNTIVERFCDVIGAHTGLVVPKRDVPLLREKLVQRLRKGRASQGENGLEAERYLAMLEEKSQASEREWQELVLDLTTGESYFFRDAGQMRLLRDVLFPELLRIREKEQVLRIWSAGCSSGEEPYSLAMIIQPLLSFPSAWRIDLKGTDINEYALQRAREGRYGRWAFRGVAEDILTHYFQSSRGEWLLAPSVRKMVVFESLNLIKDLFPNPARGLCDMDLIVCRNVFIYFSSDAIAGILARFAVSLRPGGYIMTGHAEVQQPIFQMIESGVLPLVVRRFPDSIVFQRPMLEEARAPWRAVGRTTSISSVTSPGLSSESVRLVQTAQPPVVAHKVGGAHTIGRTDKTNDIRNIKWRGPSASETQAKLADKHLKEARLLFEQGRYGQAIRLAEPLLDVARLVFDASLLLAQIHANQGEIAEAEALCREALRHRPFATAPHFLLASIVRERGDLEQAKDWLKKTIYLDRAHIAAYLQLAALYQEEGAMARVRQMRLAALDVLHGLPVSDRVEHYEEWTVEALVAALEKALGDSES